MIKTIADLDINWTFRKNEPAFAETKDTQQYKEFCKLNPEIHHLVIKPNRDYQFLCFNKTFRCGSYESETLGEYFVHLNFSFWIYLKKEYKLIKFERVSDMKYVIHSK